MKKMKSRALSEAVILLLIFIVLLIVAIQVDLFELVLKHIGSDDRYELDEIILSAALFSIFTGAYAFRRWFESSRLLRKEHQLATELSASNKKLNQLTEELSAKEEINTQLNRLVNYLQVCKSKQEAFQFIQNTAERLFSDCSGAVFISKESNNQLVRVARWGDSVFPEFFPPDDCWSLRLGKAFVTKPAETPLTCKHISNDEKLVHSCYPLLAYGEVIGLMHVSLPESAWDEQNECLKPAVDLPLEMFTEQISLSLSNIELHLKLSHMAIHDPLTGLYNRHYLEQTIEREIFRAKRNETELGLLMMDIDHFKTFNDSYGHAAGDKVLAEVEKYVVSFFRIDDFCCRYGGEEFVVLLSDVQHNDFIEKCELLRQGIEELKLTFRDTALPQITATIGAAIYPDHGEHFSELIEAADAALYRGKRSGRNCFQLADK